MDPCSCILNNNENSLVTNVLAWLQSHRRTASVRHGNKLKSITLKKKTAAHLTLSCVQTRFRAKCKHGDIAHSDFVQAQVSSLIESVPRVVATSNSKNSYDCMHNACPCSFPCLTLFNFKETACMLEVRMVTDFQRQRLLTNWINRQRIHQATFFYDQVQRSRGRSQRASCWIKSYHTLIRSRIENLLKKNYFYFMHFSLKFKTLHSVWHATVGVPLADVTDVFNGTD